MRPTLIAILTFVLAHSAAHSAEPFTVTVPGQGWTISFESPSLQNYKGQSNEKAFQFQSLGMGFSLSIFVEDPNNAQPGHAACADYYWPLAKRNPLIVQESVKTTKMDNFVKVTYNAKAGDKTVPNVNYYFAFQGKWIDVHVSRFPSAADDAEVFARFEKTLAYKLTK